MKSEWAFDQKLYEELNVAREPVVRDLVAAARASVGLSTAIDVGCGLGHFCNLLYSLGLNVLGVDARNENVEEARRRYPHLEFRVGNVEDARLIELGKFDLVFCFGLFYHLENPFLAFRHLSTMTSKLALLEGICYPSRDPIMVLLEENQLEDQGVNHVACYPSQACLVKMLYRSGFLACALPKKFPAHRLYQANATSFASRTLLAASKVPFESSLLVHCPEEFSELRAWSPMPMQTVGVRSGGEGFLSTEMTAHPVSWRVRRFLRKPWHEKFASFYARWRRVFPNIPVPVRLPFGAWFLARNDFMGSAVVYGGFELGERAFVSRFLKPGMTVLDVGAHQGLYTLLASNCIGPKGRVFAFEPSPRERQALRWNVRVNRCHNAVIESVALGNEKMETEKPLYVVDRGETGCNSLNPPAVANSTSIVQVRVSSLDQCLAKYRVESVHFIKLDVEGAELSVLQGAQSLLHRLPRPVILAEVQDIRTRPWGYPAREIIKHLSSKGYHWFAITDSGSLLPLDVFSEEFDGNFVAFPDEIEPQ